MHIITKTTLKRFWLEHPLAEPSLRRWVKETTRVRWQTPNDVKQTFASADFVGNFTIFNIGGNNYRLITLIDFSTGKVFIRQVLIHSEYDKNHWKKDNWFNQ